MERSSRSIVVSLVRVDTESGDSNRFQLCKNNKESKARPKPKLRTGQESKTRPGIKLRLCDTKGKNNSTSTLVQLRALTIEATAHEIRVQPALADRSELGGLCNSLHLKRRPQPRPVGRAARDVYL
ncbi:hypothetical protein EVAR_81399_1 [Eumeta japonica]|uniref:Uncharacterized protein n=1 Tax=Eumeta variegata TaxID=151549 RepID=A0A4C1WHD9_EUMVA|nr:hypothetical protein EVAR_81399_1 [Eumeta japonica]